MPTPFVHSRFPRHPNDHYRTIDSRCIYGLLQHIHPTGLCADVCAPDGSGIVDTLVDCGFSAVGLPDAFAYRVDAQWIITNPPYKRGLVDTIINRQIQRVESHEVAGFAALLRSGFDFAAGRIAMFDHPLYHGQIKLRFRPWWSAERTSQPIHSYVWQIWMDYKHTSSRPVVLYSSSAPYKGD